MKKLAYIFLAFSVFTTGYRSASASLMITTPRIVFEGRDRGASVNLLNTGNKAGNYRVFFSEKMMDRKGHIITLKANEKTDTVASAMLRYTPRRVTISPKKNQRIRLALRKPAGLADGEYRSHLTIRSNPPATTADKNSIIPIFEFSIPVIIRHGKTFATADLSAPRVEQSNGSTYIKAMLKRTGNRSLYGNIAVYSHTDTGEAPTPISQQKGIAVYPPLTEREINIPIPESVNIDSFSRLKVVFQEDANYGGSERAEIVFAH